MPPARAGHAPARSLSHCFLGLSQEKLASRGIRCPYKLLHYREGDAACPPDLEAHIGSEAVQEIRDEVIRGRGHYTNGSDWWDLALPSYVTFLRLERTRLQRDHAADLEYEEGRRVEAEDRERKREKDIEKLEEEMDSMRDALQRAKGREEALHAVIQRCRWA